MKTLKLLRTERKITLEALSEKTDITIANLSLIERGYNVPNAQTRQTLEQYFGCIIDFLNTEYIIVIASTKEGLEARLDAERTFRRLLNEVVTIPSAEREAFIQVLHKVLDRVKLT